MPVGSCRLGVWLEGDADTDNTAMGVGHKGESPGPIQFPMGWGLLSWRQELVFIIVSLSSQI